MQGQGRVRNVNVLKPAFLVNPPITPSLYSGARPASPETSRAIPMAPQRFPSAPPRWERSPTLGTLIPSADGLFIIPIASCCNILAHRRSRNVVPRPVAIGHRCQDPWWCPEGHGVLSATTIPPFRACVRASVHSSVKACICWTYRRPYSGKTELGQKPL